MGTVLPTDVLPVQQANERFVHEGRCLKHVAGTLAPEIPAGKLAKLRVDERYELVESGTVAFSPGDEQFRDLRDDVRRGGDDKVCRGFSP